MWAAVSLPAPKLWPPATIHTARPALRRRSVAVSNSLIEGEGKTGGGDDPGLTRAEKSSVPTGADVLKALERATAQKVAERRKKNMEISRARENGEEGEEEGPPCNFNNVRPLRIKPEWGDQLEELQQRLEQLIKS